MKIQKTRIKDNPFHYSVATRVRVPYLKRYLDLQPGDRVLDVGCGVGYFTRLIQEKGVDALGIDVDSDAVTAATQYTKAHFALGSIDQLPVGDSTFDKVICSEVLEHIADDVKAVSELRRVAKEGATVMITVPCMEGVFGSRIKSICHNEEGGNGWEHHQRDGYTKKQLRTLLQQGGISILKERYTMVFFTELMMGATKLAYSATSRKHHLHSQKQVLEVGKSPLLRLYRIVFPLLIPMMRLEDLVLSRVLRGHMLVVQGVVHKG